LNLQNYYLLSVCRWCVGAEVNVLQSIGFVRLLVAHFILLKYWHFIFYSSVSLVCRFLNVPRISNIHPIRLSLPQNYKTLLIYPNMSKGNFSMP
jgi:hypothetical protein